jgi:apolipoprotein N-acyltransferase
LAEIGYHSGMSHKIITVIAWAILAFIVFATLSPIGLRPHIENVSVERFGAFAFVGLLFGLAYPKRLWLVLTLVCGTAFVLEALQHLTPDRHGHLADAIVKFAGGVAGVALSWLITRLLKAFASSRVAHQD